MTYTNNANRWVIESFLQEYKGKNVRFFPNSGNAGDSLIACATMHCFKRVGVSVQETGLGIGDKDQTVFLGGGGNLIPDYDTIKNALEFFVPRCKRVVLLPHTIRGHEQLISSLPSNAVLFSRDVESYLYLLNINPKCEVYLASDMAFHLEMDDFGLTSDEKSELRKEFNARLGARYQSFYDTLNMDKIFYAREDGETTGVLQLSGIDLSSICSFGVWGKDASRSSWIMLDVIRQSPIIHTDRLHVGIGSALLNHECVLYDNSYGKNYSVFKHSLRNWSSVRIAR